MNSIRITILLCVSILYAHSQDIQRSSLPLERIFSKPYIAGTRPSVASLSPDGNTLLYFADSSSQDDLKLWMVETGGGVAKQISDSSIRACQWSHDGKQIAFVENGDLFLTDDFFRSSTRLTRTPGFKGSLKWSRNGELLAFSSDNVYVAATRKPGFYQLTKNKNRNVSYSISDFSLDSKHLLFVEYNNDGLPEFMVPRYTEKEVTAPTVRRGFERIRLGIAAVESDEIVWLKTNDDRFLLGNLEFSPDGKTVLYEQFDTTRHLREIYVCDSDSGGARLVYTEFDKTWIEEGIVNTRWTPDGKSVLFTSERDGWNHLYLMRGDSTNIRQLTSGNWEVSWFSSSEDGRAVYFRANKDDHHQWQLYSLSMGSGEIRKITSSRGSYDDPVLSKRGNVIVCDYSDFNKPSELVALKGDRERKLTATVSDQFFTIHWIVPEILQFKAKDGTMVPAMLYRPSVLDTTRRYPCVVFVHGAGYTQNVVRNWSYYYREYMFHTYLVQNGYIVFEVDYRGSAGYGKKYRTDIRMHLGGLDLQDELDGVEYLKSLGYIDSTRIGMYGGSYGGFLPLMALFTSPHTYACAAVLRAVTSWENYYRHNPWYTVVRLGTPETEPDAYTKSSPLTYADSLTKPLLILHGMIDDNVFFQDAVLLVDKLQKAGKKFELMMYPSEEHSFQQPESWIDEYRRIYEFFEEHIGGERPVRTTDKQ